jgi:hypothetical protein
MPHTTFFQFCPVCGRGLLISVEWLGQRVACTHCRGRFQALDTSYESPQGGATEPTALDRAEALLRCLPELAGHHAVSAGPTEPFDA